MARAMAVYRRIYDEEYQVVWATYSPRTTYILPPILMYLSLLPPTLISTPSLLGVFLLAHCDETPFSHIDPPPSPPPHLFSHLVIYIRIGVFLLAHRD